jgi:hypothetical protein
VNAPTARQLADLERAVSVLRAADARTSSAAYIPHKPSAKQAEFLAVETEEALYGGAAGGGKSDALLMAALEYVHVPGYAALILRRTYQDLARSDAIMARADEWLRGTNARWRAETRTWHFPSGATLSFGYFDTQADRRNYQGGAWQFIAFDELTQFPEAWYLYLFSRLRKTSQPVPLRMRAATNPGDIGHEWVLKRFIEPGDTSRPFVPAKLDDNPHLDREAYRRQLSKLDEVTRRQLEDGAWIQDTSGLVYHYDEGRNAIAEAPKCTNKILALDFGVVDPTSFTILEWRDHDPTVYITRSWKVPGMAPGDAAEEIAKLEREHAFNGIVGDVGGLGKGFQAEAARRFHVPIEPAEKANKLGYISLFNGDLEKGRIKVVRGACESLIKEWKQLPWHESKTREHAGFDNHCADGALYGWRKCMAFVEEPKPPPQTREQILEEQERKLEDHVDEEPRREAEWWAS